MRHDLEITPLACLLIRRPGVQPQVRAGIVIRPARTASEKRLDSFTTTKFLDVNHIRTFLVQMPPPLVAVQVEHLVLLVVSPEHVDHHLEAEMVSAEFYSLLGDFCDNLEAKTALLLLEKAERDHIKEVIAIKNKLQK